MEPLLIDDSDEFVSGIYDQIVLNEGTADETKIKSFFDSAILGVFPAYLRYKEAYHQIFSVDSEGQLNQAIGSNGLENRLGEILQCQKLFHENVLTCARTGAVDLGDTSFNELEKYLRI